MSLSNTRMPFRKTCSFRNSLWSCSRIGVRFIGEKPIAGIPTYSGCNKQTYDLAGNSRNGIAFAQQQTCNRMNDLDYFFPLLFFPLYPVFILTARMNRLSVAAGNISFSRVIFLQWRYWHETIQEQVPYSPTVPSCFCQLQLLNISETFLKSAIACVRQRP